MRYLLAIALLVTAACKTPVANDPASLCAAMCEHISACGGQNGFDSVKACATSCEADSRQSLEACRAPMAAYERCMIALPCADVKAAVGVAIPDPLPCATEIEALLACEPREPHAPFIEFQF